MPAKHHLRLLLHHMKPSHLQPPHQTLRLNLNKLTHPHRLHPRPNQRLPPRRHTPPAVLHRRHYLRQQYEHLNTPHPVTSTYINRFQRLQHRRVQFQTVNHRLPEHRRRSESVQFRVNAHCNLRRNSPEISYKFRSDTSENVRNYGGDPHRRWINLPSLGLLRHRFQKRRPLTAEADVEIDDVDIHRTVRCIKDRLIGGETGEHRDR
ncbi:hypothetical protein HanXRQr2_Chr09g0394071 [Helianthus annuus]|uniref:Uncharacterized protein n=1 Tax=Helianthus annuus TaxID=4232 RepID=A0A251V5G7_HELAN|nr:hypothetical protein HanXRQr2_Chr09g0394071 [Helianthus annuus]